MRDFKKLEIWKDSHQLVLAIYKITQNLPKEGLFGLTSQIRRSAVSVPSNIVEGCGRASEAELLRFCNVSMGSASELEYQLFLAFELSYIPKDDYEKTATQLISLKKRLNSFIQSLKAKKPTTK